MKETNQAEKNEMFSKPRKPQNVWTAPKAVTDAGKMTGTQAACVESLIENGVSRETADATLEQNGIESTGAHSARAVSGEGNAPRVNELIQNPDGSPKWENPTTVMQRGDSYGIPYKREGNAPREDLVCKNVPADPVERYNSLASPSADESSNAPRAAWIETPVACYLTGEVKP